MYEVKGRQKLPIICENFALYQFLFCFVNIVLEKVEKSLQSWGFREGRSGYSKHSFLFFFLA